MRSRSWIASLAVVFTLSAIPAFADDDGHGRVRVLWFPGNLGRQYAVDDAGVAREVRHVFGRMGVDVDWTTVTEAAVEYHGEVVLMGLPSNPLPRPSIMGADASPPQVRGHAAVAMP